MISFKNKVAAITGAGSGIGRAIAQQLARNGCHLALSDISMAGLEDTVKLIGDTSINITLTTLDVSNREDVHHWADDTVNKFGKVNLIFNNAGVALCSTVESASYDDLEWILGINYWGVVYGTRAFLPYLKKAGDGHIVNISSVFGLFSLPSQSAYNATKFAVRGYTESLRQELDIEKCGVSATCVHPGGIKTNIAANARVRKLEGLGLNSERARDSLQDKFSTTPEKAASVILAGVRSDARRVLVGPDAKILEGITRLVPERYHYISKLLVRS